MANQWFGVQASQLVGARAVDGLNRAAEYLLQESQKLAPEETGSLEDSAQTHNASIGDLASQVQYLKYYAVWQHEKLNYHHSHGQAKFLEAPMVTHSKEIGDIIAQSIRQGL